MDHIFIIPSISTLKQAPEKLENFLKLQHNSTINFSIKSITARTNLIT
jgi:hypothetical protein